MRAMPSRKTAVMPEPEENSPAQIEEGTVGYYTGIGQPASLAEHDARLGDAANTVADLGWLLGTKPAA